MRILIVKILSKLHFEQWQNLHQRNVNPIKSCIYLTGLGASTVLLVVAVRFRIRTEAT